MSLGSGISGVVTSVGSLWIQREKLKTARKIAEVESESKKFESKKLLYWGLGLLGVAIVIKILKSMKV